MLLVGQFAQLRSLSAYGFVLPEKSPRDFSVAFFTFNTVLQGCRANHSNAIYKKQFLTRYSFFPSDSWAFLFCLVTYTCARINRA